MSKLSRISIRPKVYRNTPGFSVSGKGPSLGIFGLKVHTKSRRGAEIIKRAHKTKKPWVASNAVRRVLKVGG